MRLAQKLLFAAILTSSIFLVELIGGLLFGSLSLVADSFHVILDVVALLFSFGAMRIASRQTTNEYTFGYHRLEIFAALINGIMLTIAIIFIIYEVIERLLNPVVLVPFYILIIAIIGLGFNLFSIKLLSHQHEENINVESAYLHVLGDTLASIAVIIGALFILFLDFYWIDPIVAILIVGILIRGTYRILKESVSTLMQKSPLRIDLVKTWLMNKPKINDVHDLHIWRLCSDIIVLSCHVVVEACDLADVCKLRNTLNEGLKHDFKVRHSTIQFDLECDSCICDLCHDEHPSHDEKTCPID